MGTLFSMLAAVLLITISSTAFAANLPELQQYGNIQWPSGYDCNLLDGRVCGHNIDRVCEKETGICLECTSTVYCKDPLDDLCKQHCPVWFAQNAAPLLEYTTSAPHTTASSQWAGECGSVEPTCLHNKDYFCDKPTGICVKCSIYCSGYPRFYDELCMEHCPEWYKQHIDTSTTRASFIPKVESNSTEEQTAENTPDISNGFITEESLLRQNIRNDLASSDGNIEINSNTTTSYTSTDVSTFTISIVVCLTLSFLVLFVCIISCLVFKTHGVRQKVVGICNNERPNDVNSVNIESGNNGEPVVRQPAEERGLSEDSDNRPGHHILPRSEDPTGEIPTVVDSLLFPGPNQDSLPQLRRLTTTDSARPVNPQRDPEAVPFPVQTESESQAIETQL